MAETQMSVSDWARMPLNCSPASAGSVTGAQAEPL